MTYIKTESDRQAAIKALTERPLGEYGFGVSIITGKRTEKQRSAIEVYCRELAIKLNDAGLPIKEQFLGKEIELEWSQARVKDRIWKPTQLKLYGKKSTTDLDRKEVGETYEHLARFFAETVGLILPFPEQERG